MALRAYCEIWDPDIIIFIYILFANENRCFENASWFRAYPYKIDVRFHLNVSFEMV